MRHHRLAACAGLALAAPALAQTAEYLVLPHSANGVMLLDPATGGVVNSSFIADAGPAWNVGISVVKAAVQVGDEIWLSVQANDTILRFDLNGTYYGKITESLNNVRGMWFDGSTVWVINAQAAGPLAGAGVHRFSPSGVHLGAFDTGGSPWDVAVVGGQAYVTSGTTAVNRYDAATGAPQGVFFSSAATPWQIMPTGSGNFLLAGQSGTGAVGIYELDSSGAQVRYLSTGTTGVRGMAELGNGNFVYSGSSNIHVYATATGVSTVHVSGSGQHITRLSVNTAAVGACCALDGTCQLLPIADCGTQDGIFRGDGTACATAACPPTGACCANDGTCSIMMQDYCTTAGRTWQGAATTCAAVTCPTMLVTPAASLTSSTATSGIYFDLTATSAMTVSQIDFWPGTAAGNPVQVDLYTREGTYAGFDHDPVFWTQHPPIITTSAGSTSTSPRTVLTLPTPVTIGAGQTVGVYLVGTVGGYRYRSSTTANPVSDIHLSLESNLARPGLFAGTAITGRRFAGVIHYTLGSGPQPCYANCDESTQAPVLNVADFGCFLTRYAAGEAYANCDESTQAPALNVADFGCFLTKYAAGCP
ncbi:MAG: hypothetical protein WD749_06565 [Phycisphaerales bacterium]